MKRAVFCLLGALTLVPSMAAGEGRTFFGLTFPEAVDGAKLNGFQDYESKSPGLGYSAGYTKPGFRASVYVYDFGLPSIPDGTKSSVLREHFGQAKKDVSGVGYDKVEGGTEFTVGGFLCASYLITDAKRGVDGADSLLCMAGRKGKFLKFRITSKHTATSAAENTAFVAAFGKLP